MSAAQNGNRVVGWLKLASPAGFYPVAGRMQPWFWLAAVVRLAGSLWAQSPRSLKR